MFVADASDVKAEVDAFYAACEREARLDPTDHVVGIRDEHGIAGIVRLSFEQGFISLRSMQVRPQLQRSGLGKKILHRFAELLEEKEIQDIYCMPYSHLEKFYGLIGFVKVIDELSVPPLLWKRFDKHCNRKPSKPVILMRRLAK